MFDLGPAANELSRLVVGVRDDQLDSPTPCAEWSVIDLLAHVNQFATVFAYTARKEPPRPPEGLADDWREAIPIQLDELVHAWQEASAWHGQVSFGGLEMAASDNAAVALEELTVHGWDLARATGQDFDVDDVQLDQLDRFFELFAQQIGSGGGPFAPEVSVADGASRLDRTLGRTGREPSWGAGR